MQQNISRTLYSVFLQASVMTGIDLVIKPNTTLNQKFGINASAVPNQGQLPKLRYFGVGNGGHTMFTGAGGRTAPRTIPHQSTHSGMYNQLPFVLRRLNNDLTLEQRARFGLRRVETHNSLQYAAYYLRKLDMTNVTAQMLKTTVVNGTETTVTYNPTSSDLSPTPPQMTSDGVVTPTGDYTHASVPLTIDMNAWDANEFKDVANILYSDPQLAIISELALVSGIERTLPSPADNNGTINMDEVVVAQIMAHVGDFQAISYQANGFEMVLDVGATDPLFILL